MDGPTCPAVFFAWSWSMSTGVAGGLRQQLGLARALHGDEPPGRLVDRRLPDGQQPVVRQDDGLVPAERVGQSLALLEIEHDTGVVVEQGVVAVERAGVLGDRIEQPAQRRPGLAVHGMRVRGGHDVGSRRVHLRVDGERGQRSPASCRRPPLPDR